MNGNGQPSRVSRPPVPANSAPNGPRPVPVNRPNPVPAARPPQKPQPRTKTADISAPYTANTAAKAAIASNKQKKERTYAGSDEGGNTVVSVIKAVIYIIFILVISVFISATYNEVL